MSLFRISYLSKRKEIKLKKRWRFLSMAVFFLVCCSLKAGEFPLKVNDVSGLNSPWPMVASIPFGKGELKDASAIRIISGNREVPSQVDLAATWRDGSIRWALAGFTASPQGQYSVQYGAGVKRAAYSNPLKVGREPDGNFTVDTGVAFYQFNGDKLLPENGWLVSGNGRIQILANSGGGAYLVDNSGRTAKVAGQGAQVENEVLKEGPARLVLKRSGWYITEAGEKLARAETWFYFSAGTPYFKVTHSLVITEDTNKVWFKDYGLDFKTPSYPYDVYCTEGIPGRENIKKIASAERDIFILQDTYPHFAEREYKASIGSSQGGQDKIIEEMKIAGDWAYGDYGNHGITIVMPWLAERFPKEISFGPSGARVALWSKRCGRELDFRTATLSKEYWQKWVKGIRTPQELNETPSNAQGIARTHDLWVLPRTGSYDENAVKKSAVAAARAVLVLADPEWLCATEAMGWPVYHKDTEKFPEEEQLISDWWKRLVMPLEAFPMNGFIAWGCYPDVSYHSRDGYVMSGFSRLTGLKEYGLRRVPPLMYARSGERKYYEYGYKFCRFTGDYGTAHWDVPGKDRGSFIATPLLRLPLFWEGNTSPSGIIDGEIKHWLNDYYLTGDEYSFELIKRIKELYAKKGYPAAGVVSISRILLTLSVLDWNPDAVTAARDFMHGIIDMESENAIKNEGGYGSLYKDERDTGDFMEYYLETGDELVKEAFLKLLDHRYRFDRRYNPLAHRNYDALTHSVAYWMTGDEKYRRVVEQTIGDAIYYSRKHPLTDDLKGLPENPLEWKSLPPFLGQHEYHTPFMGMPAALKLFAEKGWRGKRTPVIIKPMDFNSGKILFPHRQGEETKLSIFFSSTRKDINPQVFAYPLSPGAKAISGIKVEKQKRRQWPAALVVKNDDIYHSFVTVPSVTESGLYLLSFEGDEPFTLMDITGDKAALYCPEGFWSASGSPIQRVGEGSFGRGGEGMPVFFRVPSGLEELQILLARPAVVKRPDGSVAVELSDTKVGKLSIPAENNHGIWSIEPFIRSFKGDCPPAFFKLLNVEPAVAFGSPDFLPEGITGKQADISLSLPEPLTPIEFLPGIQGKALRLSGNRSLKFSPGQKLQAGGYTYFPGKTGTAEFWFRADLSTQEIPILMFQSIDFPFIRGPYLEMRHRYWLRGGRSIYSMLQLELLHEKSESLPMGFQSEHFFKAGKWIHITYTWDIREGEKGTEGNFAIFINGEKLPHNVAPYGLSKLTGKQNLEFSEDGKEMVLGPFDGSIDMLRISDTVRYTEDFTPSKTAPEVDENTRALFLFDGNLKGVSAFSKEPVEAK